MKLLIALVLLPALLLLVLIEQTPIAPLLGPRLPAQLQAQQISGTIMSGQLSDITHEDFPWPIQTFTWHVEPLSLLKLQPIAQVTAHSWSDAGHSRLNALASYQHEQQTLTLSEGRAKLQLAQLAQPLEMDITGEIQLEFDTAIINRDGCQAMTGHATLVHLHMTDLYDVTPQRGTLDCHQGALRITLPVRDPQMTADIVLTLTPKQTYQLDAQFTQLAQPLERRIAQLVAPQNNGSYNVNVRGYTPW